MTDWSVSRKLDEVIEQNKEIINLMKMQMIVANPNVDFFDLRKQLTTAERIADGKLSDEKYAQAAERKEWQRIQQERKDAEIAAAVKRNRVSSLEETNSNITDIINSHDSDSTTWMPSYDEMIKNK